jgi:hypothetical protein
MNAWLITWQGTALLPENAPEKVAAILSSRKSDKSVADSVELLFLRARCSASDMAYYANRRRDMLFKVQDSLLINHIPHGDRIFCGSSECAIYARKVSQLKIKLNKENGKEILTWIEPPTYRWKDEQHMRGIVLASEGENRKLERDYPVPLEKSAW